MSQIVGLTLPFFGLIFIGFAAGRSRLVPPEGLAGLEFFVVYLAMPALFFQIIAGTPLSDVAGPSYVLTTTFATYCSFAIAFSIGALINGGNVGEATIQGLVGSYGNIGFLAPALAVSAFGTAAAVPTALIFTFDGIMLLTLTPLMMALGGAVRADPLALGESIARQALLHPFVLAIILGFAAAAIGLRIPGPIDGLLSLLRAAAAPCALFTIGVALAKRPMGKVPPEVPVLVGVKLVVHPLIVYLLLSWVGGFAPLWVYTAVLLAALPPATEVFVLARRYSAYAANASTAIVLGTVIAIASVTVVLILLVNDILPIDPFR